MTRVLVCGGRDYGVPPSRGSGGPRDASAFGQRGIMCRALDAQRAAGMSVLIHGGAPGADAYAAGWAKFSGVDCLAFPADWKTHGKRAGPIRNAQMLVEGRPDIVIAFPRANGEWGSGTLDMIRKAKAAGVEVRQIPSPTAEP